MDLASLLQAYGGQAGIAGVAVWLVLSDRKHSAERRAELRQDIDREQADNARLREALAALREENETLRERLRHCGEEA